MHQYGFNEEQAAKYLHVSIIEVPLEWNAVMTIRSVKILLVCNTDFFGQYLDSILGKSQFI